MSGLLYKTVAQHLTRAVSKQRKTLFEIAVEIGYVNPDVLSNIMRGNIKLPFDKVIPIAKALEINSGELFYWAMLEYAPDAFEALRPFMRA